MTLVVRGARLIDGTGRGPIGGVTLVIEGDRIRAIDPAGSRSGSGATIVDVGGRTVVPGFFNCHVHLQMNAGPAPLADLGEEPSGVSLLLAARRAGEMLRHGITTIRDCGARDWQVIHLRDAIAAGIVEGPRIFACGRAIAARDGHAQVLSEPVEDVHEVADAVRRQLQAGADFVKVMATGGFGKDGERLDHCELSVEQIRTAVDVAHAAGKRVAVHAYGNTGIRQAIAAGADTIEHAAFLDEETIGLLCAKGIPIVPTLTNTFRVSTAPPGSGLSEYMVRTAAGAFPTMVDTARRARTGGVTLAFGTDAGSWLNAHTDIATELRLRVEVGAAPVEALRMATLDSARSLGVAADLGSLEPGKIADLVVLDGDPLVDLAAVSTVYAVYKGGRRVASHTA